MKLIPHSPVDFIRTAARFLFACGVATALFVVPAGTAQAQAADPWEAGCLISGLDPNGDGYLSIRTGPGTDHPEIARVRNGDALFLDTRKCHGDWCFAEGAAVSNRQTDLRGWFYTGWCEFYP